MTTTEKLAKVKREFAREGYETEASLTEAVPYDFKRCARCHGRGSIFVHVKYGKPKSEKPLGKGKKAHEKYQMDMMMRTISSFSIHVCADRPACRLRTAKRAYRTARREEWEQRRRERALRV